MALKAAYDIRCSCGATFTGDVYEYVFAEYDPELKDAILSGEFNRVRCPSCGQGLPVENRYLYRDEKNRLWVWVCNKEDEPKREKLAKELIEKNARLECHFLDGMESYRKLLVFGREDLIGLLLKEDPDLQKSEKKDLKRNPAFRWIRAENEDPGFINLPATRSGCPCRCGSPKSAGPFCRAGKKNQVAEVLRPRTERPQPLQLIPGQTVAIEVERNSREEPLDGVDKTVPRTWGTATAWTPGSCCR